MEEAKRRYVGIDLGKREYTMAIIGKKGKTTIHHGKTSNEGRISLYRLLEKDDRIALEAGNLSFIMAYEIQKIVGSEVRVLNSAKLPFIWDAPTKTDKEDAIKLAKLVEERRDDRLPIVPLPSKEEMGRREIISNYGREMRNRTRAINTLHSLFVKQGITTVVKKNLATAGNRQEAVEVLTGQEREDAKWQLSYLEMFEKRIKELKDKILKEAKTNVLMILLQTIAGVGPIVAYAFVAYVGDGSRFSKGAQVSNYIGFVPRLYQSGTIERNGPITKRGNGYLRGLLVQAAWAAVFSSKGGALRERYYIRIKAGHGKKKTIVGIARRLVVLMHSILLSGDKYEVRPYKGPMLKTAAEMAAEAMSEQNVLTKGEVDSPNKGKEEGPCKIEGQKVDMANTGNKETEKMEELQIAKETGGEFAGSVEDMQKEGEEKPPVKVKDKKGRTGKKSNVTENTGKKAKKKPEVVRINIKRAG